MTHSDLWIRDAKDRRDEELYRMTRERDKEVQPHLMCFDCDKELRECDLIHHRECDTGIDYECTTCQEKYEDYDGAFNCHATQEIRK